MTNHPDETHSLRERVDEAISWFTGTDEPAPVEPDPETPDEAIAPEVAPAGSEGTEPVASEPAPVAAEVAEEPVAYEAPVASEEPVAAAEPIASEPVSYDAASEPVPARAFVEPAPATSSVTWPGADAATPPVSWPRSTVSPEAVADMEAEGGPITPAEREVAEAFPEPVTPTPEPTTSIPEPAAWIPEPVEGFTTEPVASIPEPTTSSPEPSISSPEPAEGFSSEAAADAPVVDEPEIEEPAAYEATSVESSDVDEPTRIHPIDASLGAPIVDESAADDVVPAEPVEQDADPYDPIDDDYEPLAADAAADAEAARQRSLYRDAAPTAVLAGGAVAGAAALGAIPAAENTAVLDAQEAARLRREERAARDRQLGKVIASQEDDEPPVIPFSTPSTYKGLPSFGFFLFRLIIAGVLGIRAWQHITHLTATQKMWEATVLQSPATIAWVQIGLEIGIALMLVLGLGTRIAGILLVVLSVMQLAFVQWGAVNPFQSGAIDFIGIVDVMLAGAGLLLATVGGGRAAIDGAIHKGAIKRKNSKLFA